VGYIVDWRRVNLSIGISFQDAHTLGQPTLTVLDVVVAGNNVVPIADSQSLVPAPEVVEILAIPDVSVDFVLFV